MDVREKLVEQAISHFRHGVSHDIFSEPVTTYAKLAIEALEKEIDKVPTGCRCQSCRKGMNVDEVKYYPARMDYPNLCKPYSNADRIRNMSDEELKKFICSMFRCEFCDFELGERCGLLIWLQQPAEGE